MGANANLFNNQNLDPATYGLTTKAQCREKISKLQIEIDDSQVQFTQEDRKLYQDFAALHRESHCHRHAA